MKKLFNYMISKIKSDFLDILTFFRKLNKTGFFMHAVFSQILLHFVVCAAGYYFGITETVKLISAIIVLLLGLAFEFAQERFKFGIFSYHDIVGNVVGISIYLGATQL